MKLRGLLMMALAAGMVCACSDGSGYETLETNGDAGTGVIVKLKNAKAGQARNVRVQVLGDKIIRVTATPGRRFPKDSSLITVPQAGEVEFSVSSTDETVTLRTSQLRAEVSRATGQVRFLDAEGKEILSEDEGGGRSFEPIEVEGTKAWTVRQVFKASDEDEAIYGLGQHQSTEFNYKGKNEELYQYNTKISVPFIVSTKGYGVLWDSYSYCRFGDARDYAQLGDVFTLYDKDGEPGALTGTYIPGPPEHKAPRPAADADSSAVAAMKAAEKAELERLEMLTEDQILAEAEAQGFTPEPVVRRESQIYFDHQDRATHLQTTINQLPDFEYQGSHVTFEGEIEAHETGTYRFLLYYAGYTKLYIDGEEIVPEIWRTAWNPNNHKFSLDLEAGRRVPIRIEWRPDGAVSYLSLRALSPVPDEEQGKIAWWGEMQDAIDYYFILGEDMDEVISGYRTLTGKSQIMPKWAMGYWQSRERYSTQDQIVGTLAEFRRRHIPIDNIVQDWNYWADDQWGSHEFEASRYPDPKRMVDDIHAMHGRVMVSVWPKFYINTEHYKEFERNGWMYMQAVRDSIRDWVGPGYVGSFYDAYSAPARRLFWRQMADHLYPLGFDSWWMDASEPNIRDCTEMDYRKALTTPTALGPSAQYFNAYALMNAEAIYEGQRGIEPDRRVFLLTRSGFAGLQRYSTAVWSGDIGTRWEDMRAQITAGLNFCASGIPYWSMDIGGFSVENRYQRAGHIYDRTGQVNEDLGEWRELNTRWQQFGAFCPLYRSHGQYPYREPWNLAPEGDPCYNSVLYYIRLRYSLMPYIYSLAGMTWFDDYTIMRPLSFDFTSDEGTWDIGDQYMFGPALMVSPVCEYGARTREVYFPEDCGWYDFYSGKWLAGGQTLDAPAPYERIPLYVREGSIIPFGPDMEYTDERPADPITVYVYTGSDGAFTLYEDEGTTYGYERGECSFIPLTYDDNAHTLTIGERRGEYPGMLRARTFNVVKVSKDRPQPYDPKARGKSVRYDGSAVT
ncbi:MAG: DUF5110 domain-containing protein, partial [Bacteroidales bacterium]|nr:DUF5110 domain-containing protein [Bacteroidales bacterium]